mmetsp:Transcript_15345/g.17250  ORF Transcript_15345/g.17250 Transcript_15345/m.17250 type:complete len:111 (-) Transcript_15345:426-758(-)
MSKSSFNDGVKIVPRYLNVSVYEKNLNSLIIMSAVSVAVAVLPGGGIYIASVFDLPSFLLSPQWTVSPNRVKCDLMSFEASSMSFRDKNTYSRQRHQHNKICRKIPIYRW